MSEYELTPLAKAEVFEIWRSVAMDTEEAAHGRPCRPSDPLTFPYFSCKLRAIAADICRGAKRVKNAITPFIRPATTSDFPRFMALHPIRATSAAVITLEPSNNFVPAMPAR